LKNQEDARAVLSGGYSCIIAMPSQISNEKLKIWFLFVNKLYHEKSDYKFRKELSLLPESLALHFLTV